MKEFIKTVWVVRSKYLNNTRNWLHVNDIEEAKKYLKKDKKRRN